MPEVLQRERMTTEQRLPRLYRNRVLDYTLMAVGAVVAAFGAYTLWVPESWWLADLAEGWYLGSFMLGGVILAAGFGLLGASARDRAGYWSTAAVTSFTIAVLAIAGAVAATVVLII